jgi:hypothetical protein
MHKVEKCGAFLKSGLSIGIILLLLITNTLSVLAAASSVPRPIITIHTPYDGATFNEGDTIGVYATASNAGAMGLYLDGTKLTRINGNTLNYNLTKLAPGSYTIRVSAVNFSNLSNAQAITIHVRSNLSDARRKAIDYAYRHWEDGNGLCAEFVSNCLINGGLISSRHTTVTDLYRSLIHYNRGERTSRANVRPGDIVMWYSYNDLQHHNNQINIPGVGAVYFQHVAIINRIDNNGTIRIASHNSPHWDKAISNGDNMIYLHLYY